MNNKEYEVYHKEQSERVSKIGDVLISALEDGRATFEVVDSGIGGVVHIAYNGVVWTMRKMWDSSVFTEVKMGNGIDELILLTKKHSDRISEIIRDKMCEQRLTALRYLCSEYGIE